MPTHAEKTKSQAVINGGKQNHPGAQTPIKMKEGSTQSSGIQDNRSAALSLEKLNALAAVSPQAIKLQAYQQMANNSPFTAQVAQLRKKEKETALPQPVPENNTASGLPDKLKAGIERLSGFSMDDVQVHYNSAKPAELNALAYAQGSDIHLGRGQEKHLPHEAWHVVQQKQQRVKPTIQLKGKVNLNENSNLEREAIDMGKKLQRLATATTAKNLDSPGLQAEASPPLASNAFTSSGAKDAPVQLNKINDDIIPSYVVGSGKEGKEDESSEKSLVHRGLVETEMVGNKKYVRAYQTVYASVEKGSSWKDTQQDEDKKIRFLGKGDTWINFGNPLRALHYVRTYYAQAPGKRKEALDKLGPEEHEKRAKEEAYHGKPVVRSFLIPFEVYLEITSEAISEKQRAKLGDYNLNVDKSKAPDQYQVMEKNVKKMTETALPGSMISYVLDNLVPEFEKAPEHGKVKGIKELTDKLGLPGVFDPLMSPMEGTEVPKSSVQEIRAKELGELYDLSFFKEKQEHHPKYSEKKLSKNDYWELALKHEDRISELALKYLKTDTLPDTKKERDELRMKLASAANAALIPKMIEENYNEGTIAMFGKTPEGKKPEGYAQKLAFKKVLLQPLAKEKKAKLTQEEILRLREEAKTRKEQAKKESTNKEEEDYKVKGLFD